MTSGEQSNPQAVRLSGESWSYGPVHGETDSLASIVGDGPARPRLRCGYGTTTTSATVPVSANHGGRSSQRSAAPSHSNFHPATPDLRISGATPGRIAVDARGL